MDPISFEQVSYDNMKDIKPILTNLVHTFPHWHHDVEMIFVCSGTLHIEIHGECRILKEGDIGIVNSEEIHSVNSGQDDPRSGVLLLQISSRFFRSLNLDIESLYFGQPENDSEIATQIRHSLLHIIHEIQNRESFFEVAVHGHCNDIVVQLCRHYLTNRRNTNRSKQNDYSKNLLRIKGVFSYVQEHYKENPSIADIAAIEFISPYYLSHLFSNITGMTYSKYLNSVKIDMVLQDLLESDDGVTEIMMRHGFSNPKSFHRIFKQRMSCSPTAYRRANSMPNKMEKGLPQADSKLGNYVSFSSGVQIPSVLYRSSYTEGITHHSDAIQQKTAIAVEHSGLMLDRYYKTMTAVGRASDLLRSETQSHLKRVQEELGFSYIRFHNIFGDEMGILHPKDLGRSYNFTYVDMIFDFLMQIHMRPFVELGFMPTALASGTETVFFYKGNITPPKDYTLWESLVRQFIAHLVSRYTIDEVSSWYFEIWNEPNLSDFWAGTYKEYIQLYEASAKAIKSVDSRLKIGGPSISSFQYGEAKHYLLRFLNTCHHKDLPVDFISGHPYPVFYYDEMGRKKEVLQDRQQTKADAQWFRGVVHASHFPKAEIHLNEWNSTSNSHDLIHDTAFMATFLLHNLINCQNMAQSLTFWVATDLFEEGGIPTREFHGGFGLLSKSGFVKPQYLAYQYLNRLGNDILQQGESYIATKSNNKLQLLFWNYCHYNAKYASGDKSDLSYYDRYKVFEDKKPIEYHFILELEPGDYLIEESSFDRKHGSIFDFWLRNGGIEQLSPHQLDLLKKGCHPEQKMEIYASAGALEIKRLVHPFGFRFIEIHKLQQPDPE